jgi:hypothetical protein
MDFDFRFRNASGKWESVGHRKAADWVAAFESLREKTPGGMRPGRYMSRPRGRQKDWDLFSLDRDGEISGPTHSHAPEQSATTAEKQWLR